MPDLASLVGLTTGPIQLHDVLITLKQYLEDYQTGVSFDQVVELASADVKASFARSVLPGAKFFVSDAKYRTAREVHLPKLRDQFRAQFAASGAAALVFRRRWCRPCQLVRMSKWQFAARRCPS